MPLPSIDEPVAEGSKQYSIYVISDGTGETAAQLVRALITQFPQKLGVYIRRYSKIKKKDTLEQIIQRALESPEKVMVAYTIVSKELCVHLEKLLKKNKLVGTDFFAHPILKLSEFFQIKTEENVDKFHAVNENYYRRMAAIEFTLRHDDGQHLEDLDIADIVLVGGFANG